MMNVGNANTKRTNGVFAGAFVDIAARMTPDNLRRYFRNLNVKTDLDDFDSIVRRLLRKYDELPLAEQLAARDGCLMGIVALGISAVQDDCCAVLSQYNLTTMAYLLYRGNQRDHNQFAAFVVGFTDVMQFWGFELSGTTGVQEVLHMLCWPPFKTWSHQVTSKELPLYFLVATEIIASVIFLTTMHKGCTEQLRRLVFSPSYISNSAILVETSADLLSF